ncbi:MAG: SRPBCC family protein [Acetobacterales bacterium]
MATAPEKTPEKGRLDLELERVLKAPRAMVWRAWTEPEQLKRWFTPAPWKTVDCAMELRPGGRFYTHMRGPEGEDVRSEGCVLDVETGRRLVFTDTLLPDWRPAPAPFFTAVVTMEDHPDGTLYRALAMHKDDADRKKHEDMGFHEGWGTVAGQLEQIAQELARKP